MAEPFIEIPQPNKAVLAVAFNGTVRSREKVMRSLKREDSPILGGYQIFHNYVRPHEALDGKTPSEACGIEVQGENRWVTLIQNSAVVARLNEANGKRGDNQLRGKSN